MAQRDFPRMARRAPDAGWQCPDEGSTSLGIGHYNLNCNLKLNCCMNELILCCIFVGFLKLLIKLAGEKIYLIENLVTSCFEKLRLQEKGFFVL